MQADGNQLSMQQAGSSAYFLSLEVENVRCFGTKQALDLSDGCGKPARWTVLLGDNGTGKTTLLQALASYDTIYGWNYSAAANTSVGVRLAWYTNKDVAPFERNYESIARFRVTVTAGQAIDSTSNRTQELEIDRSRTATISPANASPPFITCYGYGSRRGLSSAMLHEEEKSDATDSLFRDHAQLCNAEEWLLRLDYSGSKESPIQQRQIQRLSQVKSLLTNVLPGVTAIRFTQPSESQPTPTVEFETFSGWVTLRNLGHGYRSMIAWMVDFSSRMVERYPDSPNPLAEPAVVLVDEIDLHLHPKWQRELTGHLLRLFPNTQFIVTAHSPLIIQAAGDVDVKANIAVLRKEGDHVVIDNDVEAIRGWRVDQILTSDLYDLPTARPAGFDQKLARRQELLTQPVLTQADRDEVAKLEQEIGVLPGGETADEAKRMMRVLEESNDLLKKYGG